jgi:D-aspartate ligase
MTHPAPDPIRQRLAAATEERDAVGTRPHMLSLRSPSILKPQRYSDRTAEIPVLIFGSGLTALGVLRSFRAAGITAYSVCPQDELPVRSRWYRPPPACEKNIPSPEELGAYLESFPLERAVLVPCSDDWTRAIAELPNQLKDRFPASVACPRVVQTMTDKWLFASLLDVLDIPRPRTLLLHSLDEMAGLDDESYRDMFLKPLDSQEFARRYRVKGFQLKGRAHALEIMAKLQRDGKNGFPILLQEYIPGPTGHYYLVDGFVDRRSCIRAFIARRRLSQYPPHFGNSSRSQTIPLNQVGGAVESLTKMWSTLQYRGIFDAEFKFDARDGLFKILEVNARPWWFIEFATRCGVDLCGMAYADALGLPVETVSRYDTGRCCVHLSYDLAAHWTADPGIGGLLRWLRSCKDIEDIFYRWDDPWPGITSTFSSLRTYLRRVLRPRAD